MFSHLIFAISSQFDFSCTLALPSGVDNTTNSTLWSVWNLLQQLIFLTLVIWCCASEVPSFLTHCGLGSDRQLTGLWGTGAPSVTHLRLAFLLLYLILTFTYSFASATWGSPPSCRVGSCYRLTGLVVCLYNFYIATTVSGVGAQTDCPLTGYNIIQRLYFVNFAYIYTLQFFQCWHPGRLQLSTPAHCGVGSRNYLSGLLVYSLGLEPHHIALFWHWISFLLAGGPRCAAWRQALTGPLALCGIGPRVQLTGLRGDPFLFHFHIIQFQFLTTYRYLRLGSHYFSVFPVYTLLLAKGALAWCVGFFTWWYTTIWQKEHLEHLVRQGDLFNLCTGKSGPKSRHNLRTSWGAFGGLRAALLWIALLPILADCRGEGSGLAMETAEAPYTWLDTLAAAPGAKQHGKQPPLCVSTPVRLGSANKVVKRSLLRAAARARKYGMAWYRGRSYTLEEFANMGCGEPLGKPDELSKTPEYMNGLGATPAPLGLGTGSPNDVFHCNTHHSPKRRLKCWMWNSGGLSLDKFDEVKLWLDMQAIDVAIFIESKWSFDSEWVDSTWNFVHSGSGAFRGQGILVMVRKAFCPGSKMLWQHSVPGRLLHMRLQLSGRPLDVVACYQFAYTHGASCLKDRERWWVQLETLLHSIPHRNSLLLLGDFNTSLHYLPSHVGTSEFRWRGSLSKGTFHSDTGRFMNMLRFFGLVVLNSWSSALGPTYIHQDQGSRIDYMCVRKHQADGLARQVQYLWQSPFLQPQRAGHVPMMCTLAKYWVPENHDVQTHGISLHQRRICRQEFHAQTDRWLEFSEHTVGDIKEAFAQASLSGLCPLDQMHARILSRVRSTFSDVRPPPKQEPWVQGRSIVLNKWKHRALMKQHVICTFGNVLKAWFHAARFQSLKRQHRRAAYVFRKVQFQDIVASASVAAQNHDTHKLFSIINHYSPKQPKRKIQLRNSDGTMASPVESAAMLHHFVEKTWAGPAELGLRFSNAPGVPFSETPAM